VWAALPHRLALVTGASRGIAKSIGLALANAGCHVAVNYHLQAAAAEEVRASIEKTGRRAVAIQADVSVPPDVDRLVALTERALREVGILVHKPRHSPTPPISENTLP